jgi:hypothetical protein
LFSFVSLTASNLREQLRVPLNQPEQFHDCSRRPRLTSLITRKSDFPQAKRIRQFSLRKFQALPDTTDISADITLHRSQKPTLRLRKSPVTFCIPYTLAARWAEITMHCVQGQRLSSERESLIAYYCHHFWMVASWTSHDLTSFFLKLDDRRPAISKTSNPPASSLAPSIPNPARRAKRLL